MLRTADAIRLAGLSLLAIGVIAVHSAGMDPLSTGDRPWWGMFATKHAALAAAAAGALLAASFVDPAVALRRRGWRNPLTLLLPLAVALCGAVLVRGIGVEVNGATRWLAIPGVGLTFQPSELMKWTLVAALAAWCGRRADAMHRFRDGLLPAATLAAVACGLVVKEDLGTAALLGGVAGVVLLAGGARLWHLVPLAAVALAAGVAMIATAGFRVRRLAAFLDPWADPLGAGYHPIQSMLGFAQGGLTGVGLGHSVQKFHVPEATTDFILPVLSEELGVAAVAAVLGLYAALLWLGFAVIRRREDRVGRLLALGIVATITLQAAFNVAVVAVVVPTKGIALPLISAGGTGWLMTAAAVGALAGLARRRPPTLEAVEQRRHRHGLGPVNAAERRASALRHEPTWRPRRLDRTHGSLPG